MAAPTGAPTGGGGGGTQAHRQCLCCEAVVPGIEQPVQTLEQLHLQKALLSNLGGGGGGGRISVAVRDAILQNISLDTPAAGDGEPNQMMLPSDMILAWDPAFRAHLEVYASNEAALKADFGAAFKKLTELGCGFD